MMYEPSHNIFRIYGISGSSDSYIKAYSDDSPDIRYIRIFVWIIYKHVQYTFRIYGISGVFLWMIYDHLQVIDLLVVNIFRRYGISGSFHHCITFFKY